jgi:uncharacterized membrane protein YbhN (UPF0104 family)
VVWQLFPSRRSVLLAILVGAVAVAMGASLVRLIRRAKQGLAPVAGIGAGLLSVAQAFACSLLADGLEVALIVICLASLGVVPTPAKSLVVFAAVNAAIALPSAPGNLGTLDAAAALALMFVGVRGEDAVSFALLYRIVQWVPATAAAAVVWALRSRERRARLDRDPPKAIGRTLQTWTSFPQPEH